MVKIAATDNHKQGRPVHVSMMHKCNMVKIGGSKKNIKNIN